MLPELAIMTVTVAGLLALYNLYMYRVTRGRADYDNPLPSAEEARSAPLLPSHAVIAGLPPQPPSLDPQSLHQSEP